MICAYMLISVCLEGRIHSETCIYDNLECEKELAFDSYN